MTLFRENALKAVQSPELTHSVTTVVAPSAALGILAILFMLLAIAVWGWFANIPMAVQGSGMVVLQADWQQALHENDVVQAMKREQLTRVTTLLEKKREMYLNHQLTETDLMAAESEVMQSKMAMANPEAPYALGASHPFGAAKTQAESAVALVLVNNQAAKQLSPGMQARVYPGNQMNNESAAVNAVVAQVTEYPVSKEIALSYLGNRAMVDALFSTGIPHLAVLKSTHTLTPGSLITANVITHTCHPVQLLTQADCG